MEMLSHLKGPEIRLLRHRKKLSQAKLAGLLKVPQAHLSQWELGKSPLPLSLAERISELLDAVDGNHLQSLRKKRYQRHHYVKSFDAPIRIIDHPHKALNANKQYLQLLTDLETRRRAEVPRKKLSAIALFAGCGGLSLGFSWAGFSVRGFVERESAFRAIYQKNFPDVCELGTDVTKIKASDVTAWGERFGDIDVLFGGPPCQGFSLTGKRDRFDPRNQLFRDLIRIATTMRPRAILMENVRLLTSMKSAQGNWVRDEIAEALDQSGYQVAEKEVDAQDYGVPQHRERVFFMGLRKDLRLKPSFPEPTHDASDNYDLFTRERQPFRTFRVATCDLELLESGQQSKSDRWHQAVIHPQHVIQWLRDVPEGGTAHDNPDPSLRPLSGYNTTYKRLCWDEPSSTISTTFGMISGSRNVHPYCTRSLTVREALRCQSFPDSFELVGSLGSIRTSIGNAVPPLLAFALATHINQLLDY
jgi:DNA (cytosine-5)-methyltransferase 1